MVSLTTQRILKKKQLVSLHKEYKKEADGITVQRILTNRQMVHTSQKDTDKKADGMHYTECHPGVAAARVGMWQFGHLVGQNGLHPAVHPCPSKGHHGSNEMHFQSIVDLLHKNNGQVHTNKHT